MSIARLRGRGSCVVRCVENVVIVFSVNRVGVRVFVFVVLEGV